MQLDTQRPATVAETGDIRPDDFGAQAHLGRDEFVVGVGEGEQSVCPQCHGRLQCLRANEIV